MSAEARARRDGALEIDTSCRADQTPHRRATEGLWTGIDTKTSGPQIRAVAVRQTPLVQIESPIASRARIKRGFGCAEARPAVRAPGADAHDGADIFDNSGEHARSPNGGPSSGTRQPARPASRRASITQVWPKAANVPIDPNEAPRRAAAGPTTGDRRPARRPPRRVGAAKPGQSIDETGVEERAVHGTAAFDRAGRATRFQKATKPPGRHRTTRNHGIVGDLAPLFLRRTPKASSARRSRR